MFKSITLVAHRGYSSKAPENTLVAFLLAVAHGYRDIEFDVQLSSDGIPVLFHDDTLDRTTDGSGRVDQHSYTELSQLDAGSWFGEAFAGQRIPRLEDALKVLHGLANIHIELKSSEPVLAIKVASALRVTGWLDDHTPVKPMIYKSSSPPKLVISSFNRDQLARSIKECGPDVVHELLVIEVSDESLAWAAQHKVRSYNPDGKAITPELIRKANRLHLHIGAWWCSREEQDSNIKGLRYAFVDAPSEHKQQPRLRLRYTK